VQQSTNTGSTSQEFRWSINSGAYASSDSSDWAVAAVLLYSSALTNAQMGLVEAWLDDIYCVTSLSRCFN
jgi:hypothetical protein